MFSRLKSKYHKFLINTKLNKKNCIEIGRKIINLHNLVLKFILYFRT